MNSITAIAPVIIVAIVVWIAATAVATGYGRLGRAMRQQGRSAAADDASRRPLPSFAIIVTAQNQADALRRNLPPLLGQDYPDYEVIVADMASDDDTAQVLEGLEYAHPHLRHTRTPASARDISLERLALNLTLRSARSEWVVVVAAATRPATPQWLRAVAREATEWRSLLIGTVAYAPGAPLRLRHERLWATIATANHTRSGHAPLLATEANVALRRERAIALHGQQSHPSLRHGTLELLANSNTPPRATAYMLDSATMLTEDAPTSHAAWRHQAVVQMETRRHARHIVIFAMANAARQLMPWMLMVATGIPLAATISAATDAATAANPADAITAATLAPAFTAAILLLMLLAYAVVKLAAVGRTARQLGMGSLAFPFLWYELMRPVSTMRLWWRWMLTPHNDFRKKFV